MCVMQQVSSLITFPMTEQDTFVLRSFSDFLQMSSWGAETVIKVPNKKVEGWALPEMPGEEFFRLPS